MAHPESISNVEKFVFDAVEFADLTFALGKKIAAKNGFGEDSVVVSSLADRIANSISGVGPFLSHSSDREIDKASEMTELLIEKVRKLVDAP